MSDYVVRFSLRQRVEHAVMIVVFTVLCVTGLPQKYFQADVSIAIVNALGGLGVVRWLHRAAGVIFVLMTVAHLWYVIAGTISGRMRLSMAVTRQDFRDAITTLRYYLGVSNARARFGRYDYKQKFEYWGLIMGGLVIGITGLVLLYPIEVARVLPAQLIPVAKAAHSNEGLLAFLTIVTWHVYSAILSPEVFPLDTSIFTGKISTHRMLEEHPLEYEELRSRVPGVPGVPDVPDVPGVLRALAGPEMHGSDVSGVPERPGARAIPDGHEATVPEGAEAREATEPAESKAPVA